MNVALGGTLYTDIPDQLGRSVEHDTEKGIAKDTINHIIRVQPGSWLEKVTHKTEFGVNSRHHQGILQLADCLQVMATAPDGLVEAVILPEHPFGVGVQWHPENMGGDPNAEVLFEKFMDTCQGLM